MRKKDREYFNIIAKKYGLPVEVVEAVVRSPYEFIRNNSKDLVSVRVPMWGLFVVKPNRLKNINEGKKRRKGET